MRIEFGLNLRGFKVSPLRDDALGIMHDTATLIPVLETQLKLAKPPVASTAHRVLSYKECLSEKNSKRRFYHKSFEVDPIGVASTLLGWRDHWYDYGWKGVFKFSCGSEQVRFHDLADVEQIAVDRVPWCEGQRLQRILTALETNRLHLTLGQIVLHEDPDRLPTVLRQVLDKIGYERSQYSQLLPVQSSDNDLHRIQCKLKTIVAQERHDPAEKEKLKGDGSFIVIRSKSRDISAQAIAEMLRTESDRANTLVIAEKGGIILDNAFERSSVPRCGLPYPTRFGSIVQTLKLALKLLWNPIDPKVLEQFLSLPDGPIDKEIRKVLLSAFSRLPGVGGAEWNDAVEKLRTQFDSDHASSPMSQNLDDTLNVWINGVQLDRRIETVPLGLIVERTTKCINWFDERLGSLGEDDRSLFFQQAINLAKTLSEILHEMIAAGIQGIPQSDLGRLLDQVMVPQSDPTRIAEDNHVSATNDPISAILPFKRVVWWDPTTEREFPLYPWTVSEMEFLRTNGVSLPSARDQLRVRGLGLLRPIMNCSDQFLFVFTTPDAERHPVYCMVTSHFDSIIEINLERSLLESKKANISPLKLKTEILPVQKLPEPSRWWVLPKDIAIPLRSSESYTSLDALFYYPHIWVLRYAALLRPGAIVNMPTSMQLRGVIAHKLFERFFNEFGLWQKATDQQLEDWFECVFSGVVASTSLMLDVPEQGIEREEIKGTLLAALKWFVNQIQAAKIIRARAEVHDSQPMPVGEAEVRGSIDFLMETGSGKEVVVDAKWGGEGFWLKKLGKNKQLQLATYAYMRQCTRGGPGWPETAYFIVSRSRIIAQNKTVFRDARIPNEIESNHQGNEVLWHLAMNTYKARLQQFEKGLIEINVEGTLPDGQSILGQPGMLHPEDPSKFDDYMRLTGWISRIRQETEQKEKAKLAT